jgi:hypothetical protein
MKKLEVDQPRREAEEVEGSEGRAEKFYILYTFLSFGH